MQAVAHAGQRLHRDLWAGFQDNKSTEFGKSGFKLPEENRIIKANIAAGIPPGRRNKNSTGSKMAEKIIYSYFRYQWNEIVLSLQKLQA
jgi:hypothetical protein